MTDADIEGTEGTEPEELDEPVSTPDDGIEDGDELDSETEESALGGTWDPAVADFEGEH